MMQSTLFAHLGQMLHDETACGEVLGALRELSSVQSERWGSADAVRSPTPLPRSTSSTPRPPRILTVAERRPAGESLLNARLLPERPGEEAPRAARRAA